MTAIMSYKKVRNVMFVCVIIITCCGIATVSAGDENTEKHKQADYTSDYTANNITIYDIFKAMEDELDKPRDVSTKDFEICWDRTMTEHCLEHCLEKKYCRERKVGGQRKKQLDEQMAEYSDVECRKIVVGTFSVYAVITFVVLSFWLIGCIVGCGILCACCNMCRNFFNVCCCFSMFTD